MTSYVLGGASTAPSLSATNYTGLIGDSSSWVASSPAFRDVVSAPGTFSNFRIAVTTAPGVGKSWAFTVYVNGSATSITCTISDTSTTASDTTHTAAVVAGDVVTLKSVPSGTPTTPAGLHWSTKFVGTNANESNIFAGTNNTATLGNVSPEYFGLSGVAVSPGGIEDRESQPVATAGTIKNLYVVLSGSPQSGNNYVFTLYKNGAPTSLTVTIADSATTGNDTSHTVSVVAGDLLSVETAPNSTPTARGAGWGFTFSATTDGESLVCGGGNSNISNSVNSYAWPSTSSQGAWRTTETLSQSLGQAFSLSKLYLKFSTAPGASTSFIFTLRKSAADTTLTATVADAATTANDTTHSVNFANDDLISLQADPVNSPSATNRPRWGMVMGPFVSSTNPGLLDFF